MTRRIFTSVPLAAIEDRHIQDIRLGPDVPWTDTAADIHAALLCADNDLEGFAICLRVASILHRVRAADPTPVRFAEAAQQCAEQISSVALGDLM